jgi:ketosteroid isomerase-like protein
MQLLRAVEKAWDAHDLAALGSCCNDDALMSILPDGEVVSGKQNAIKGVGQMWGTVRHRRFTDVSCDVTGDLAWFWAAVGDERQDGSRTDSQWFMLAVQREGQWRMSFGMPALILPRVFVEEVLPGTAQDDTYSEEFGGFQPKDQSAYVHFASLDECRKRMPGFFHGVEEVRLGPEMPQCKTIGPVGLIRWDESIQVRMQGIWGHGAAGMSFAIRRDGQWKEISGMPGDWRLTPSDRYDPGNEDHVALQRLLDRVSEALVRKQPHTTRDLFHSELYGIFPDPAQPEQAFVSHGAEDRQAGEEMMRQVTFDDYRHTVTFVKVQGPLAVTISRRERTIGGQTATAQDVNFYGRTENGWQAIIFAEGDWTDLLMAEPKPRAESADAPPAVFDLSS